MRKWRFQDLDDNGNPFEIVMSEDAILEKHWKAYKDYTMDIGKKQVTKEDCIKDWVLTNWAEEVKL